MNKQAFINYLYVNREKYNFKPFFLGITMDNQLFISQPFDDQYIITVDNIDNFLLCIKGMREMYRKYKVYIILEK